MVEIEDSLEINPNFISSLCDDYHTFWSELGVFNNPNPFADIFYKNSSHEYTNCESNSNLMQLINSILMTRTAVFQVFPIYVWQSSRLSPLILPIKSDKRIRLVPQILEK